MHQHDVMRSVDAAEAVIVVMDDGVEMAVAAQGDELDGVAILRPRIDVGCKRSWRDEIQLARLRILPPLAGAQRAMEAAVFQSRALKS